MSTHVQANSTDLWHGFLRWLAKSPIASFLRVYVATLLSLAIADWSSAASATFANWKTWVFAALAAAIPVVIRAINPADTAYGNK